jgi:hypothetical protein
MVTPLFNRAARAPGPPRERRAVILGNTVSFAGAIVFLISALTMVVLWIRFMAQAMNWFGVLLGLLTSPVAVAYPFVHWFARSDFPGSVFTLWLAGLFGLIVTMTWASWGRYRLPAEAQDERSGAGVLATDEID